MAVNENQPCLIMRWCGCRCSSGAEPALPNALLTHSLTYHSSCLLVMMHSTLNLEQTQSQHHFTIWPTSSNLVAKYVYVNFQITVMKTDSWSGQQTAAVKTGRRAYFEQFFPARWCLTTRAGILPCSPFDLKLIRILLIFSCERQ